jgi:two-component system, OmpR family, response regulator MtrA
MAALGRPSNVAREDNRVPTAESAFAGFGAAAEDTYGMTVNVVDGRWDRVDVVERATVMVVEDDDRSRELISATLRRAGYAVEEANDGETAVRAAGQTEPDLVVLDVGLPGMDGWDVCRNIRGRSDVPILFVTAFNRDEDVIRGLHVGADDYLSKPFSPSVLVARVDALLRRAHGGTGSQKIEVGELTVDLSAAEVRRGGEPIHLTPTELRIVGYLARRLGEVVSAQELARAAQGYDLSEVEAGAVMKVHIRRIRQKIEPEADEPTYLTAVRGLGYRLGDPAADPPVTPAG